MARWQVERGDWAQRQAVLEAQIALLQEQLLTALTRQPEQPALPAGGAEEEPSLSSTAEGAAASSASAANAEAVAALESAGEPAEPAEPAPSAEAAAPKPVKPLTTASIDQQIWSAINAVNSTDVLRTDHDYLAAPFAGSHLGSAGGSGHEQAEDPAKALNGAGPGQHRLEAADLPSTPADQLAGAAPCACSAACAWAASALMCICSQPSALEVPLRAHPAA